MHFLMNSIHAKQPVPEERSESTVVPNSQSQGKREKEERPRGFYKISGCKRPN